MPFSDGVLRPGKISGSDNAVSKTPMAFGYSWKKLPHSEASISNERCSTAGGLPFLRRSCQAVASIQRTSSFHRIWELLGWYSTRGVGLLPGLLKLLSCSSVGRRVAQIGRSGWRASM